ncbi:MAG: ftsI [Cyanobacteria bacterium RYN_339]|nr:ftsI [Cyanobacteria bacterium RYN_339]
MSTRPALIRQRALYVLAGLAMGTALLSARLVYLQVFQANKLAAMAEAQRTKTIDLSAVRGEIVDRNHKELAVSVDSYSIYANPKDAKVLDASRKEVKSFDRKATAAALAPILGMGAPALEQKLQGNEFRWLVRQQPEAVRDKVRALKIPGLGLVREAKRIYPKGTLAATLIGFVGVDNQGLAGIENAFDKVLKGPPIKLQVQVDAYGREIMREGPQAPMDTTLGDGNQVVLTIDENLQHIAERELAKTLESSGAKRGTVLMMEPKTGNLVAFATLPTYDPNNFRNFSWEAIKNWAVTDVYEPGSTMKMFTLAGAVDNKRIGLEQKFKCPPYIKVEGRLITDHEAPTWNRELTPFDIMEVSSNVGTTQIAFTMKGAEHREFLTRMGFGSRTGSGITGESKGILPALPWRPLTQATISFGQGVSVTALQILSAASALGNDGVRMEPRLIDSVLDSKGKVLQSFPPRSAGRVMKPETVKAMMKMLEKVVSTGTGVEAQVPGYRIAGKTGTAQKIADNGRGYSSDVEASFLGFFPSNDPRFVMLTLLDSPRKVHWAAATAAPLFGHVAAETLRQLGVRPTEPINANKPRPVPKAEHDDAH